MNQESNDWLETRLQNAGENLPYPPTPARPDLPPRLVARSAKRMRFAAAGLVLLMTVFAVPQVRAAVLSFIQVGVVAVFGDPTTMPDAPVTPVSIPQLEEILGRTRLVEAGSQVPFAIQYPSSLGEPDAVYVQNNAGPIVFLVWLDGNEVRASLTQLGPGAFAWKAPFETIEQIRVRGTDGVWIDGPHPFYLSGSGGGGTEVLLFDAANVLIWEENGVTYRLEGEYSLAEALKLAETIGEH